MVDYDTTVDVLLEYRFGRAPRTSVAPAGDGKIVVDHAKSLSSRRGQWLDDLAVRAGVRNIFDDPPPFANNTAGYPVSLNDPRQRFVFVDIEKKF